MMVRWRSTAVCLAQVRGLWRHQRSPGLKSPILVMRHSSSRAADTLRLPAGLVCLRDGNPIAAGPHQAFAAGGSLPHSSAIIAWLQRAGLLTAHLDAPPEAPPAAQDTEVECRCSMLSHAHAIHSSIHVRMFALESTHMLVLNPLVDMIWLT
jgi:hypothetical protein